MAILLNRSDAIIYNQPWKHKKHPAKHTRDSDSKYRDNQLHPLANPMF